MTDLPLIDQDIKADDFADPENPDEAPAYHTILEAWLAVLAPASGERSTPITPQWASRITAKYQELLFAQMPDFRDRYFDKIETLLSILQRVIDSDEECLNMTSPEEDVEHNSKHYVDLLTLWQLQVLEWEIDWDCEDPLAAPELAAIAEVHTMFFGDTGLTGLLDQIKFEFTDMHRDALALALQSFKDAKEGSSE